MDLFRLISNGLCVTICFARQLTITGHPRIHDILVQIQLNDKLFRSTTFGEQHL